MHRPTRKPKHVHSDLTEQSHFDLIELCLFRLGSNIERRIIVRMCRRCMAVNGFPMEWRECVDKRAMAVAECRRCATLHAALPSRPPLPPPLPPSGGGWGGRLECSVDGSSPASLASLTRRGLNGGMLGFDQAPGHNSIQSIAWRSLCQSVRLSFYRFTDLRIHRFTDLQIAASRPGPPRARSCKYVNMPICQCQ